MKTISVSKFKTHLSAELKVLPDHGELIVLDHSHPVARVLPYRERTPSAYRPATIAWEARELPPLVSAGTATNALQQDRARR